MAAVTRIRCVRDLDHAITLAYISSGVIKRTFLQHVVPLAFDHNRSNGKGFGARLRFFIVTNYDRDRASATWQAGDVHTQP